MKRLVNSKLFVILNEASQTGINIDARVLRDGYDAFVKLLYSKTDLPDDRSEMYDILCYTRVEFSSLRKSFAMLKKKSGCTFSGHGTGTD